MRPLRLALCSLAFALGALGGLAGTAGAQTTTTTMPPVRSIPVTPATTAPAAPAVRAPSTETAAASQMADTGIAADKLVPTGFLLIGLGALLHGAARRPRRSYAL